MGAKGLPSQILLDCCGEAMLRRSWRFLETLECLTALACWHPSMPPPNCVQWMPLSGRGNGGRVVTLTARPLFSALLWQPRALERRHALRRLDVFGRCVFVTLRRLIASPELQDKAQYRLKLAQWKSATWHAL